ncbi:transferase family-domain-containing protein [Mycena alexandri]|uniref:Transferase family-domain-containing protein n=1 Tax=Mycena alexandri TaxID=1745969 RepID=A0AAD6TBB5_9AGAR|nr:transferase family-domain-containing protein [Mycena alexandri]
MPQITVANSTRVFPDQKAASHLVALSILDASVGNFAATAAVWAFDPPSSDQGSFALAPSQLKISLVKTLNAYPQWAGQLRYTKYVAGGNHTSRSRRLEVVYGTSMDPGVKFITASCDTTVSAVFPSLEQRSSGLGAFDASLLGVDKFLPNTPALASHSSGDFAGLPSLIAQVTAFKCGGVVIALKSSHPLADAQTLTTFVNDWVAVNRTLVQNLPPPTLNPVFSPAALDETASGDIDAPSPDPKILKIAHELPIHRYDWWASADESPAPESSKIPPHLAPIADTLELGPPLPWNEWDVQAPVSNYLLHFSAEELTRIWTAASSPGETVSRFDALQAHIWAAIIRARQPEEEEAFHLNFTLGLRDRVVPPLGGHTLGSPIVLARASATSKTSLPQLARIIRGTLTSFTPHRVSALLHEMAFDVDARRMWAGFIGRRNAIVTSWLRLGLYEVDFGAGRPRFVHGVIPAMDGLMQVMEAGPAQKSAGGAWYREGASVSLTLATEVIERIIKDPLFRKYRESES